MVRNGKWWLSKWGYCIQYLLVEPVGKKWSFLVHYQPPYQISSPSGPLHEKATTPSRVELWSAAKSIPLRTKKKGKKQP